MSGEEISGRQDFKDVDSGDWYNSVVGWACTCCEIVNSTSAETFEPNQAITRQDMAKMALGFFDHIKIDFPNEGTEPFAAMDQCAWYAADYVQYLKDSYLIVGGGNNCFEPLGATTRAEAAECLSRISEALVENMDSYVKSYIMVGQDDMSQSEKMNWTKSFFIQLNTSDLYAEYLEYGYKFNDVRNFANYITDEAPITDNWKELFEVNLYDIYQVEVTRYEQVDDVKYQVYVTIVDDVKVSYVIVNARTGYYHC